MRKTFTYLVLGVLVLFALAACSKTSSKNIKSTETTEASENITTEEIDIYSPQHELNKVPEITIPEDATDRQKAAIESAESLLYNSTGYSETKFKSTMAALPDHFSEEETQFALNLFQPDWNKQALKYALVSIDIAEESFTGYSPTQLYELMTFVDVGFTEEQATYAIDNLNLSEDEWNAQAVSYAKTSLKMFVPSRKSTKELMLSEGYSEERISYALKHSEADWKQVALQFAKDSLSVNQTPYYSEARLREKMLKHEFTEKEIKYAIKKCDGDWNDQAVKAAKSARRVHGMNNDEIKEYLMGEIQGFTEEQAQYGVDHIDD